MDHINESIKIRLNQRALATTANAAYVCHVANELANKQYEAQSFRNGTLTLVVASPAAAHDLKYRADEIRTSVNQKLNTPLVKTVSVRRKSQLN